MPEGQAPPAALELAERLGRLPAEALGMIKEAVRIGLEQGIEAGLDAECQLFAQAFDSPDAREGITAFIEKGRPTFR